MFQVRRGGFEIRLKKAGAVENGIGRKIYFGLLVAGVGVGLGGVGAWGGVVVSGRVGREPAA